MIEVEKNVPVPEGGRSSVKYPFKTMEVGDSFTVEAGKEMSVRSSATYYKKIQPGAQYTIRRMEDNTLRVWRTA